MEIFIIDASKLGFPQATRFANDGHAVAYYSPFRPSASFQEIAVGEGYKTVKRVYDFKNLFSYDLVVITGLGYRGLAKALSEAKKLVLSGYLLEDLQASRSLAYSIASYIGLYVPSYEVVGGLSSLLAKVKPGDVVESDNRFPDDMSFVFDGNMDILREYIERRYGPLAEEKRFILRSNLANQEDFVEVLFCGFASNGEVLRPYLVGYDMPEGFFGKIVASSIIGDFVLTTILSNTSEGSRYTGPFFVKGYMKVNTGDFYFTEFRAYPDHPIFMLFTRLVSGYSDFIVNLLQGKVKDLPLVSSGEWFLGIHLQLSKADSWVKIELPSYDLGEVECVKELDFYSPIRTADGSLYNTLGNLLVGSVIVTSNSFSKALMKASEIVSRIDYFGKRVSLNFMEPFKKWLEKVRIGLKEE